MPGKLICTYFTCPGGCGKFICTYFTCPGRSWGCQILPALRRRVGPLPKNLRPEASEVLRLAEARVLRVLEAWGGSFARVLRVLEALRGSSVRILRVLEALGSSFVRILRVREVPGGSNL